MQSLLNNNIMSNEQDNSAEVTTSSNNTTPKPFVLRPRTQYTATSSATPRDPSTIECFRCHEMGHVKRDCTTPFCNYCKQLGHLRTECQSLICYNCREFGHHAKDCDQPPRQNSFTRRSDEGGNDNRSNTPYCYFCRVQGHTKYNCEELSFYICPSCGQAGHMQRDCRNNPDISNYNNRNYNNQQQDDLERSISNNRSN